jgi:hypothetical protein
MNIYFNKNAKPISDYEIENFYQENKNKKSISICNYLLLTRFRVGVKEKEIDYIKLFTIDLDNKLKISKSSKDGTMDNWDQEILSISINTTTRAI